MGLIRFVVWTGLSIAFGIFLATYEFAGRTPWQVMQTAWKQQSPGMIDSVKKKVAETPVAQPKETHTTDDKQAIDALIKKNKSAASL
ncbi:MAG: hypothetical protein QM817_02715 [Archangium sp.]